MMGTNTPSLLYKQASLAVILYSKKGFSQAVFLLPFQAQLEMRKTTDSEAVTETVEGQQ